MWRFLSAWRMTPPTPSKLQRVYRTHEGQTWFLLGGHLQTSKESPWIIVISFTLLLAGPALWLVWQAKFLWLNVSPALIVLGAYFWMSALAAMMYVWILMQCDVFL